MLLASGLPPLDLSPLFQFVFTVLLLALGLLYLVKATASRYFVVDDDARFDAVHSQPPMAAAAADPDPMPAAAADPDPMPTTAADPDHCFVCGQSTSKLCSRCKAVRYCSTICQSKHWKEDHKDKCKEFKRSNNVDSLSSPSPSGVCGKRKASLVPARGTCKVLQQPKKVLFPYGEFVKLFNWDTSGFPPCGLLNCGNSCYANVVLQCLACTRPLVAFLLEKGHSRKCNRNDWCFLCELQSHLHRVSQSLHPFSPINILSRLPNIGGNLGYGKQEDAHEFMRFAIDMMQSICLDEFGGEKVLDPSTQETTLIQHIFGGHLKSQVMCTQCNKISYRYENMMDLTVEIQGDAASLEDCLDQFTVKEWLDGDNMYKCDGCNDYVKAWKRLTIHQAPNILTIALKRFQSGRFGKLNKRVTFPETLDLGPYMSEAGHGTDVYKLYAVVVHIDMLNASFFGHYICYTTDFSGYWYRIDDCKVMEVELEEVLAQGAYMLLYSRICARQPNVKSLEHLRKAESQSLDVAKEVQGARDSVESFEIAESANSEAGPSFPLSDIIQWSGDLGYGREPSTEIHSKESEYLSLVDPIKVVSKSIRENPDDLGLSSVQLSSSEELGRNCTRSLHAVGDGSSEELEHGGEPLNTVSSLELSGARDMEWQETDTSSPNVQCKEVGTWDNQNREFQLAESSLDDYDTNEMEETSSAVSVTFVSSSLEVPQEATSGYSEPGLEQVVVACDKTVSTSGLDNKENPDDLGLSCVQLSFSEELGRNCTRSLHAVGDGSSEELKHGEDPLNTDSSLELSSAHDMEWQETDTSSPNVQCKEVGTWDNQNREFQLAESPLDDCDTNEMEETSSAVSVAFVSSALEAPQEATSTLSAGYSEPGLEQVAVACDRTVSASGLDNSCRNGFMETDSADRSCCKVNDCDASPEKFYDKNKDLMDCKNLLMTPRTCNKFSGRSLNNDEATENMVNHSYNGFANPPFPQQNGNWVPGHVVRGTKLSLDYVKPASYDPNCKHPAEELHACKVETNGNGFVKSAITDQHAGRANEQDENRSCH